MKVIVSQKTREIINNEYTRFMADPNNLARLKMKLTSEQRNFIESLQEAYNKQADKAKDEDRLLIFQEAILAFNARPELVPNAPIDLMKQNVTFKDSPDDFEQLIVLIKVWKNSVERSKRPVNRLAVSFAKWPKLALYPMFVGTLMAAFTSILNALTTYYIYSQADINNILIAVVGLYASIILGKGIYIRLLVSGKTK